MRVLVPDSTDALLTLLALAVITAAVVEIILRAWGPTPDVSARVGPVLAIGVGVLLTVLVAAWLDMDLWSGVLAGVLVGLGSMGVHDIARSAIPR